MKELTTTICLIHTKKNVYLVYKTTENVRAYYHKKNDNKPKIINKISNKKRGLFPIYIFK